MDTVKHQSACTPLSRGDLVGFGKPNPPSMTLRLMDFSHGLVANFFLPLSVDARMVGDRTCHPSSQDRLHNLQSLEKPLAILPIRTINDLPAELLTQILEYFHDDINSLKNFSLISRPFLPLCRKRLFPTLRLNSLGASFSHQCDTWMSFLNNSTDLLSSCRIVELGPPIFRLRSRDPQACSDHWNHVLEQRVPSIHDPRVQTIIRHALNPQTLLLRFEFQAWKNSSRTFQETIIKLIQRETVSSLSLEDALDFPMVALRGCRHLRELSLISFNICESVEGRELSQDEDSGVSGVSKGYLESLTLFASDQCIEHMINVLSSPQSLLHLTKLQRLSINSTGLDGRLALKKIPLIARCITTLELRVGGQNGGYDTCKLGDFPNLRSLFISMSYNRHKRPIRDLVAFLSKADNSTLGTLEELKVLFRHDVPNPQLEEASEDTLFMLQHRDWEIMEHTLILSLFPALCKLHLGFRPKDVETFMNEKLVLDLHSSLSRLMPTLYAMVDLTIEMFDDRFEQFTG